MELSIIIPTYNVELYLEECLDGIYKLKSIEKEIILIDDGSSDNSYKIAKSYQNKHPKITTIIHQKNGGSSVARNAGIKVAKGKYTYFMDSDDYIEPELFTTLFNSGKEINLDIIVGRGKKVGSSMDDQYLSISQTALKKGVISGKEFLQSMFIDSKNKTWDNVKYRPEIWDSIYKTSLLKDNNIKFQEGLWLHEDELFTPQAYINAKKIKLFDIVFYHYRQRENSIMDKNKHSSRLHLLDGVADTFYHNDLSTVFSNDFLLQWCWKDKHNVTFSQFKKVLKMKKFSMKGYIKLILLFLYCIKNKVMSFI